MNEAERFERLSDLFDRLRELPPEEQSAALDIECADDPSLRSEAEALLFEHARPQVLDQPVLGEDFNLVAGELSGTTRIGPPERIGRYTIVRPLGEGGMGTVYEARQSDPDRSVALKLIRPGLDSRQIIARFEAERQALALMDHPGIAMVLDAGTTEAGTPFFVMELVRGPSIVESCDQHRLSIPERLRLFCRVCSAIQHAHQKGIIHRDIKPSNVLVTEIDGRPQPKVIDFGIAKAIEADEVARTALTLGDQAIGTPAYMSPEQAMTGRRDIDTRSDVYALGVLLYELLTGTLPFDSRTLHEKGLLEFVRLLRDVDPPTPSRRLAADATHTAEAARRRGTDPRTLSAVLRGDLDWIVMKCLEKDRERRYESAAALAEDIERSLDHRAVLARPQTTGYRLGRFVRRHRARVAAASVAVLALVLGIVGTTGGLFWALDERARAEVLATSEAEERARAEALAESEAEASARATEQAATAEAIVAFLLEDVLRAADPSRAQDPNLSVRDAVIAAGENIGDRFEGKPVVEARVRSVIADVLDLLSAYREAEPHHRRHWELQVELDGETGEQTMAARQRVTTNLMYQGRFTEAIELTHEEIELLRRDRVDDDPQLVQAISNLGTAYLQIGRLHDAAPTLEQTLEIQRRTLGDRDDRTLITLHNLTGVYLKLGELERALRSAQEAYEGRLEVNGPDAPRTFTALDAFCRCLASLGRTDEAIERLTEGLQIAETRLGPGHAITMNMLRGLALLHLGAGRAAQAEPFARRALAIAESLYGGDGFHTASYMSTHAQSLSGQGLREEAYDTFSRALEIVRSTAPGGSGVLVAYLDACAVAAAQIGRFDEADALLAEAMVMVDAADSPVPQAHGMIAASIDHVRQLRATKDAGTQSH